MATEQKISPELIKELATAAIAKRHEEAKKSAITSKRRPSKIPERAMLELTKALSEFYGFAAVTRSTKEHRIMADIVAQGWVPLGEYDRQVRFKEEAQERVEELQRETAELRAAIEQRIKDVPRLKAVVRTALARITLDTQEKHVPERWARLLLRRIDEARKILESEAGRS